MSQPSQSRTRRRSRGRWTVALAAAVTFTTTTLTVITAGAASAALPPGGVGPIDPASQFPSYYADTNGLRLQLCQDGPPHCLAGPEQIQDVHAAGGDAEAFYFHASADVGGFTMNAVLEAAYLGDGPGQEVTFMRTQATGRAVVPHGQYSFTDPYGSYTCTADATGLVQPSKGCRFETSAVPGNFSAALGGPVGPFLTWDSFGGSAGAPPVGFIGDGTTPHTVVGSPTGFNKMRVSGPGIAGTCTNDDGSTVRDCQETSLIVIQGKVQPGGATAALSAGTLDFGDVAAAPPITRTLTYANTGDVPVTIGSVNVAGPDAASFTITNSCPVAPAVVEVGTRCTIGVTFTPHAGRTSTATLTVTDDTSVATRSVALKGSNLPVMVVSDPAPPAGLTFPSTSVAATSLEDSVVIGNTGKGPLTIASVALTGASAAHYKLGPNNTCSTPVAPGGGCEIGVQFAPTSTGSKTANLRVTDSQGKFVDVSLAGVGSVDKTAPTAPTLSGSLTETTADLTWPAATDDVGVTGYQVFRDGTQQGATLAGTARSFSQADLAPGTYSYTLRAVDAAGNVSPASNAVSLTVNLAPTVIAATPGANDTSVAIGSDLTVTFSEAVTGVGPSTFQVTDPAGDVVPAGVTQNGTTDQWILNPTTDLGTDTRYTVTLTGGATAIRDLAGKPLATTSWTFTSGPAPTVTAATPRARGTSVAVASDLTVTFSEAVTGVGPSTFQVTDPAGDRRPRRGDPERDHQPVDPEPECRPRDGHPLHGHPDRRSHGHP